ncbi:MAG: uncharacterized protein KVP18_001541 [Porospora cf. gigantea A]|uniref:uncharacterized protein n=1 Tax=Porospora cf. gigantea A TaxID=2853593 RepID=UPI00355A747A|nr:MAG: hypothetical protein KVP18_001541 [Porospora cf. gigantea A]
MRSACRDASDRTRLARHEFDRVYRRRFSRVTDRSKRLRAAPASTTRIRSNLVALERLAAAWNQPPNDSTVEVDSADVVVIVTNRSSSAVYIRLRQQQSRVADWFYLRPFAHVGLTHTVVAKCEFGFGF